jgi:hypothetical protein
MAKPLDDHIPSGGFVHFAIDDPAKDTLLS